MQTIPDTFCPAKWDELNLNLNYNYAYSCCKATPLQYEKSFKEIIPIQQQNLLDGKQDPSCDYCWKIENAGGSSRRHDYLKKFDPANFEYYLTNPVAKYLEINLGNECNFQCIYCNPKASSKWAADVSKKPYKIFTDRFNYQLLEKNKDNIADSIAVLRQMEIEALIIMGGEPLVNKNLYTVLDAVNCNHLTITTNLSSGKEQLDTFLDACKKFKQVEIGVSIDATGKMAEFNRHGLNFDFFNSNLEYLINNKPDNVNIKILSLMTSITVRDIKNFSQYINDMLAAGKISSWDISTCQSPRIQSLVTLPDDYKPRILEVLNTFVPQGPVNGLSGLITELENSKFNNTMHSELKVFLREFRQRKKIKELHA